MAKLWWVGGTGNTNDSAHWSLTDGGAGGAGLPDASTDVEWTSLSNASAYAVTFNATFTCRDFVVAAPATGDVTFGGTAQKDIWGTTFTLYSGLVLSNWSNLNFRATSGTVALTWANHQIGANGIGFLGSGGTFQLQDKMRLTGNLSLNRVSGATFDPNGQEVEINMSGSPQLSGASWTFYNLTLLNSFGLSTVSRLLLNSGIDVTVTNLLTYSSTGGGRSLIRANLIGEQRTITAANVAIDPGLMFQGIITAGAADWDLSAIESGDAGNNGGSLVCCDPVQSYWYHGASASYNWIDSTRWFLGSGGTGGAGRVPLPQDPPAIFDSASFPSTGKTVVFNPAFLSGFDFSGVTNSPTLNQNTSSYFSKSCTYAPVASMTVIASSLQFTYMGAGVSILDCADQSLARPFALESPGGTLELASDLDCTPGAGSGTISITAGNLDDGGFAVLAKFLTSSASSVRSVNIDGPWTLSGTSGNPVFINGANFSTTHSATGSITLIGTRTGNCTFSGSTFSWPAFSDEQDPSASNYTLTVSAAGISFDSFNIDATSRAKGVRFSSSATAVTVGDMTRDAGTNVISLDTTTGSGTFKLAKSGGGVVTLENMTIRGCTATPAPSPAYSWIAYNSTDSGSNSGIDFGIKAATPAGLATSSSLAAASIPSPAVDTTGPTPSLGLTRTTVADSPPDWILVIDVTALAPSMSLTSALAAARFFRPDTLADVQHGMSEALRAFARTNRAGLVEVCKFELPDGNVLVSKVPYSSLEAGHFTPKVVAFGQIQPVASDRTGSLGTLETTVDLDDTDREVAMLLEGANGNTLAGSRVRRWLAHPEVAPDDWFLLFDGIVTKPPEFPSELVARFTMRVDDVKLGRKAPAMDWTIDAVSWPNAHPDALTKTAPRVYGIHASQNYQNGPGFLPGLLVDTTTHKYAFAAGRLKDVTHVYVNGVEAVSGWTDQYSTDRRGRVWTTVTFTADQGDAEITIDAEGYEDVGDGTGDVILHPCDQLAHLLSNFHLSDWRNGSSWKATDSRIGSSLTDPDSPLRAFLDLRIPKGAPYYGDRITGLEAIAAFCDNFGLRAIWRAGKLEFFAEDVGQSPYAALDVDFEKDAISLALGWDDIIAAPGTRVEHVHSASQEKYLASFGVVLPDGDLEDADELSLLWSRAD